MKYIEARPLIRSGDLLFWSHRGWSTWHDIKIQLVRFFTQSEYSHVGVAWVVGGRVFVLEAVQPLVRIFPLSKLTPFYLASMNASWTAEAEEFALGVVGEPYSQIEAIKGFFALTSNNGEWECAEYAREIEHLLEIDLGRFATPSALALKAMERGASLIYIVNNDPQNAGE